MQSPPAETAANILYALTEYNRSTVLIYWGGIHFVLCSPYPEAVANIHYTGTE
jgi:hypothetical protein